MREEIKTIAAKLLCSECRKILATRNKYCNYIYDDDDYCKDIHQVEERAKLIINDAHTGTFANIPAREKE